MLTEIDSTAKVVSLIHSGGSASAVKINLPPKKNSRISSARGAPRRMSVYPFAAALSGLKRLKLQQHNQQRDR